MAVDLASTKIDELTPENAAMLIKEMVQNKGIELELLTKEKTLPEGTKFIVNAQQPSSKGYVEAGHHRVYEGEKPIEALKAFKDPNTYAKESLIKKGYSSTDLCKPELLVSIPIGEKYLVKTMTLKGEMEFMTGVTLEGCPFSAFYIYRGKSGVEAVNALNKPENYEIIEKYRNSYIADRRLVGLKTTSEQDFRPMPHLYLFVPIKLIIKK